MYKEAEMTFFGKFGDVPIRKRICAKLKCRKRHEYLCAELPHRLLFDSKWLIEIPKSKQNSEDVHAAMVRLGAPERCHVLSTHRDKDGAEMLLKDALEMVVCKWLCGIVLISIPDRLGYYEGEDYEDRYIIYDGRSSPQAARRLKRLWE